MFHLASTQQKGMTTRLLRHRQGCACCSGFAAFVTDDRPIKRRFSPSAKVQASYERALKKITTTIQLIVQGNIEGSGDDRIFDEEQTISQLQHYANITLDPWAERTAEYMISYVDNENIREWKKLAANLGRGVKQEIEQSDVGALLGAMQAEQVNLIKSIPLDAARRVQKISRQALYTGERSTAWIDDILKTGDVSYSAAKRIARTESARASSFLTQVRAEHLGCTEFVWHAVMDGRTRQSHRELNRKSFKYDDPPIVDGQPLIPGQTYNCRCWHEPIFKRLKYEE